MPSVGVDFSLADGGLFDPLLGSDPFGSFPVVTSDRPGPAPSSWSLFGAPAGSSGGVPGPGNGALLGVGVAGDVGPAMPPLSGPPRFPLFPLPVPVPVPPVVAAPSGPSVGQGLGTGPLSVPSGVASGLVDPSGGPALPLDVGVGVGVGPYNFFAPFDLGGPGPGFGPPGHAHSLSHGHGGSLHGHGHGHGHPFGSMGGSVDAGGPLVGPASYGFTATAREFVPVAFTGLPGASQQGSGLDQGTGDAQGGH